MAEFRGVTAPQTQKDVANIDCRLAAAMDRIDGALKEVLTCGAKLVPESNRLALGLFRGLADPGEGSRQAG